MHEPIAGQFRYTLQSTRFFEEMRSAGNDLQLYLATYQRLACSFNSITAASRLPTISSVGECTRAKASPAKSGRPPREITAPTSRGHSAAATSAAPAPVLEPKYPIRRSRVASLSRAHFVAYKNLSANKLMSERCWAV